MRVEVGDIAFDIWPFGSFILIVLFILLLIIFWWRKRSFSYLLCLAIFSFYLLMAADKIFFPIWLGSDYAEAIGQVPFTTNINLIPFYFGPYGTLESSLETLMLNVLLTMPFGFGISFLARVKAKHIIWIALAVGLGIETAQLIISLLLGYVYWIVDVNDVLMNALGVLIGYGIFRVFAWVYMWVMQHIPIKRWGLIGYVYEVSSRADKPV